jgi:hypothetical protein
MEICAICGINEATTRDHVPRPENLITVPACAKCNNGASNYDDLFKVYLSMHAVSASEIAKRLFREKTVRTLERNRALLAKILEESKDIQVKGVNGNPETHMQILWNSEVHDAVIERIIRGLYFHHTGSIVPKDTALKVQWLKHVPEEIESQIHLFTEVNIGDEQVIYKYLIYKSDPRYSLWIFEFYGAHWASGHISPTQ